ncbi:hypothetical protein [Mycoplasma simbae]|uniref:hypothetical protein n=1 Tax=Mycoplasma simbae TaxID=36744 RepID=UPI0004958FAE|nr:hypothetical protein [Mycoplasma simbae]
MKRKIILSSSILASLTLPVLSVSCGSNSAKTDENGDSLESLKAKLAQLQKSTAKANAELQAKIRELEAQLAQANQEKEESANNKSELEREIEKLKEQVDKLDGTQIKRNNLSAKELLFQIGKFLTEDFPQAMESQKPEEFNSNRDLFNQIKNSVVDSLRDFETTEETFANIFTWQNAIFYNLNRSQLVAEYVDNPNNPVTIAVPKSELMDVLFDWRISDLTRLETEIAGLNEAQLRDGVTKASLTELVSGAKAKYQSAKDSASLLAHQISSWFKLERDNEHGVINKIVNFNSTHYRSLLPKFNLPNFRISLFPVYKQIVDEDFKTKARTQLTQLNNDYKNWLDTKGSSYIYSARFEKLYNKAREIVNTITRALTGDNLNFYNEFQVWEDLDKFVTQAQATLFEALLVDPSKEKTLIDSIVDREFNVALDNSFAKTFDTTYKSKSTRNDKEAQYLYKGFYSTYSKEFTRIFNLDKSTYTKSFDRYTQYLVVRKQVEISQEIINLYTNLGENIEDAELKALLKWDNSAKFDRLIQVEQRFKETATKSINDFKSLLDTFTLSNVTTHQQFVEGLTKIEQGISSIETFISSSENHQGSWSNLFEETEKTKLHSSLNDLRTLTTNAREGEELSGNALTNKIKEVNDAVKYLYLLVFGYKVGEQPAESTSELGKFNKALKTESYPREGSEYDNQIKIFLDLVEVYASLNDLTSDDQDLANKVNAKKSLVELLKTELETIKDYGKKWGDLYFSEAETIRDTLKADAESIVADLTQLAAEISKTEGKDINSKLTPLKTKATEFVTKIGKKSDNNTPDPLILQTQEAIDEVDSKISRFNRRKEKAKLTAKFVAGQEIYVLTRYWQSKDKDKVVKGLLNEDTHPNKELAKYLSKLNKDLEDDSRFRQITGVKPNVENFDMAFESGDPVNPQTIYNDFIGFELAYGEALYKYITTRTDSNKEALKAKLVETRKAYYDFLNGLSERQIFLGNTYIRFGSDQYVFNDEEPNSPDTWVGSHVLKYYATVYALTQVVKNITDGNYIEG